MASIAFDNSEGQAKPPITEHPAFPAIVALWFAVLLGLGSLVLPAVLLERGVSATGLASLVPAAAPPLGATARSLIAVVAALAGAGLGISLGRRLAARPGPGARSGPVPLNVKDELGEEGLVNGRALPLSRRRALSISDGDGEDTIYTVPLPGDRAVTQPLQSLRDEPLELTEPADAEGAAALPPARTEDLEMAEQHDFEPDLPRLDGPAPHVGPIDEASPYWCGDDQSPPFADPAPELEAKPALADAAPEPEARHALVAKPALSAVTDHAQSDQTAGERQAAPLEELGLVQLVQRLGSTIERRRERLARPATPSPVVSDSTPVDFEAAPAEEAVQAMAAYFGSPAPSQASEPEARSEPPVQGLRPEFLDSLAWSDAEDEAPMPVLDLPLHAVADPAQPAAPFDEEDEHEEEAEDDGGAYSSLLGMSGPFARPPGNLADAEEPAAGLAESQPPRPFDPPGTPPPPDADAALRTALATLQRMSGTL